MIDDVFGIPVTYENWDKQRALPLYIAAGYNFQLSIPESVIKPVILKYKGIPL